ncbi:MAG TPA: NAD(P)/FAD-dependent oxidoreductase [Vicinamibacterales bacterium]|nr:NAD(P)/FAD-dependent oxidoreductase [Vicinamibacterales bacterium]
MPRVVIVGGGFGGLAAAKSLRGKPVDITLVDRRNHHLFSPLLYQVASAGLSPGDIASPIRWILRRQRNVEVLLGAVERVDPDRRIVHLSDGTEMAYDYVIVAAGATHAYFGHDDWQPSAPGLKTLEDALRIRRRILLAFENAERESDPVKRGALLTFVIVGGGPTGVELAGALAEIARHSLARDFRHFDPRSAKIILLEAGPSVLATFPESLREAARHDLVRIGVDVRTSCPVTRIEPQRVEAGGTTIDAGTILWAAGVAASPLGRTLGAPLDRAGRVLINPDLTIPGHSEVFVIGDLASLARADGRPLPGVAQVAIQMGVHASRNIVRAIAKEPLVPFKYRNLGDMATIGRAAAVANLPWIQLKGLIGWLAWLFIHLVKLIGFRNRVVVMVQWIWAYITYQRAIRLITGDRFDS